MKHLFTLFFALLLASSLVGCGENPPTNMQEAENETDAVTISQPTTSEITPSEYDHLTPSESEIDTPSEKMIHADLLTSLAAENQFVSFTNAEIIKSLTDEGRYCATMSVTAESKYADWQYEVEMVYTKYDQGWMIDDIKWTDESYTVSRIPEPDEMEVLISNYRDESKIAEYSFAEYMIPIYQASVSCESHDISEKSIITFCWDSIGQWQHAISTYSFTSKWEYDSQTDSWKLCLSEDTSHGYHLTYTNEVTPNYSLDFSGIWESIYQENYKFSASMELQISNFSWEEFDAVIVWDTINIFDMELAGTATNSGHFIKIESYQVSDIFTYYVSGSHIIFSCGESTYITFTFEKDYTRIHYLAIGAYGNLEVCVYSTLPLLE